VEQIKTDRLYIRADEEFKKQLQAAAEKENRSLSNYIENILKKELERKKAEN